MPIASGVMVLPSVQEGRTLMVGRRMRETSVKGREGELEAPKDREGELRAQKGREGKLEAPKGQEGRWRGRKRRRRWTGRQRRCWKRWWSRGMRESKKAASGKSDLNSKLRHFFGFEPEFKKSTQILGTNLIYETQLQDLKKYK